MPKCEITYATISTENEELQSAMDEALALLKEERLGVTVPMYINGERIEADAKHESFSPINTAVHLCTAQQGTAEHARAAIVAAKEAFDGWRRTPWEERVQAVRGIAQTLNDSCLDIAAVMVYEVGKSRMEAIAEVAETRDSLTYYAQMMKSNRGYSREMGKLRPGDPNERNVSVSRPHGVWVVISPFNFPLSLSAAPIAAALLTGNTVVFKGASDTVYDGWKTAELFAEAGLPPGVFNYVSGSGAIVGQELLESPGVDGWTFTGSYRVGMNVYRQATKGRCPRPAIVEMGGKNPAIVSDTADLETAVTGVVRAAFGLDGQKCSACSRVYVHDKVYEEFRERLLDRTGHLKIGDPTRRDVFMGTLINRQAYEKYQRFVEMARTDAQVLTGGEILTEGELGAGYYVQPTIVEGLPEDHDLVREELFVPLLHLARVSTLSEAMMKANDTLYGLTAGFYGQDKQQIQWFLENIEAGTVYVNRPGGATTGAWPGVQAFGGWKGSGSSGKGIGGFYTLPLYMREQSQTILG
jgi:1-pyrroline-5-carboxylate dehydrogenase